MPPDGFMSSSSNGHQAAAPEPVLVRTECHGCGGVGHLHVHTASLMDGEPGTLVVWRSCSACQERNWLPGLVPPV